jgi:glycosyltransferase involved in cell wall biosynthesis
MSDSDKKIGISLFFPVYNDERTVRKVCEKSLQVLAELSDIYELIIIDDCSPDRSGAIADEVAGENPGKVRVIHHERNLGYGVALRAGLQAAQCI